MPERDAEYYTRLASWMEQPLLPGEERDFQRWINGGPERQLEWQRWQHLFEKSKQMHIQPPDLDKTWHTLRHDLGLKRQRKAKTHTTTKKTQPRSVRDLIARPFVVTILAMTALSAYFFALYLIREYLGFGN